MMKPKATHEFTCYELQSPGTEARVYVVEHNDEVLGSAETAEHAFSVTKITVAELKWEDCGYTEAFGRNRQWVQGPRGGWKRYNGD